MTLQNNEKKLLLLLLHHKLNNSLSREELRLGGDSALDYEQSLDKFMENNTSDHETR